MKNAIVGGARPAACRRCARSACVGRDPRAGAREGQRRHHHEDRARGASRSRRCAAGSTPQSTPRSLKNDEQLKKALAEVTPQLLVDAIDEMLLLQLGKEKGYQPERRAVQGLARRTSARSRTSRTTQKFKAALKQEGMTMDDLRKQLEKQFTGRAGPARRGRLEAVRSPRKRRGSTTSRTRGVRRAGDGHAARDPHRGADHDAGRAGRRQRRAGRRGAEEGDGGPRARDRRARTSPSWRRRCPRRASKANGGLIGPISLTELSPELQQLIEKMKPGDVTQPIRAPRASRSSSSRR